MSLENRLKQLESKIRLANSMAEKLPDTDQCIRHLGLDPVAGRPPEPLVEVLSK